MGMIWIIYPIFCVFMALCGVMLAEAKGRSRLLWGFLGLLFNVVAILILGFLPRLVRVQQAPAEVADSVPPPPGTLKPVGFGELPKPHPDQVWAMLTDYDPAVRAAVMELKPYGDDAINRLRDAHLTLRDPSLLPDIVARIRANGGQRRQPPPAQNNQAEPARNIAMRAPPAGANGHKAADNPPTGRSALRGRPMDVPDNRSMPMAGAGAKLGLPAASGKTGRPLNGGAPAKAANARPAGSNGSVGILAKSAGSAAEDDVLELGGALPTSRVKSAVAAVASAAKTTEVVEKDLDQANYVGEHKGVHLFKLRDGRVYIDRFAAVPSVDDARRMIDAGLPLPV